MDQTNHEQTGMDSGNVRCYPNQVDLSRRGCDLLPSPISATSEALSREYFGKKCSSGTNSPVPSDLSCTVGNVSQILTNRIEYLSLSLKLTVMGPPSPTSR